MGNVSTTSFQELIEKEREQRRVFILDAAEELFLAKGFSRVSMDDIAKKVGMNKATIYIYFEDKDSLFFGIALRRLRERLKKIDETANLKGSGRERVLDMIRAGFAYSEENPEFFQLFSVAGPERFNNTDNPLAKVIVEILVREEHLIQDALEEGIADGSVRDDLDPREMAGYISAMCGSIGSMDSGWRAPLVPEAIGYQQYRADFLRFLDGAIARPSDGRSPVTRRNTGTGTTKRGR